MLEKLLSHVTDHQVWDVLYGFCFALGLLTFNVMRAGRTMRLGLLKSRRQYFHLNWDSILVRSAVCCFPIFVAYRHDWLPGIVSWLGWHFPFQIPQAALMSYFLGFFSDPLFEHVGSSKRIPSSVRKFLEANVPPPVAQWDGIERRDLA